MFRSASVPHSTRKNGKLVANYNYNHYNLPFSHIMVIVIISDEDMLKYFGCSAHNNLIQNPGSGGYLHILESQINTGEREGK